MSTRALAALLALSCSLAHAAEDDNGGLVARLGLGVVVPTGKFADVPGLGMQHFGNGGGITFTAGYYLNRHLGFLGGVRYTFFHPGAECNGGCSGMSFQVPVLVEYAFAGRKSGLYAQAGLGLFTRYTALELGGAIERAFQNDILEYKLALGHRWVLGPRTTEWALDVSLGADLGRFHDVFLKIPDQDGNLIANGNYPLSNKAWHATFGLTAALIYLQ